MADNTQDPGRKSEDEGRESGQDRQQQSGQQGQDQEFGSQRQQQGQQGTMGQQSQDQELGSQQREPLGASHQHSADGGSVTAAGGSSTGPGAGQAGTDRDEGFIGSQSDERDPQQAGFAEQGRGAPDEGRDVERGGERTDNSDTDIEGSSKS